MKIVYSPLTLIPKRFCAVLILSTLYVRLGTPLTDNLLRHEKAHAQQAKNLLYLFFYLLYVGEWVIRTLFWMFTGSACYQNLSFEREARHAQNEDIKITTFSWIKYIVQTWRR